MPLFAVAPGRVEPRTREAVRRELETASEAVAIVQVSRLEEWKGHRALLTRSGCFGTFRVGHALYLESLKNLAADLQIKDRIRLVGQRSDALYAGLPVVATAIGGAPEIVDGTCRRLVPPADIGALRGLAELIGCDGVRRRLASQGPARARALCDPKQQLLRIQNLLSSIRANPGVHGEPASLRRSRLDHG